ncbi:MAG: 2-C-methyl-D-erythritol 4-phosphate cytidylyltransferase, partial [Bacteroidales bacterium]|nr:2-C-methyl-D-erythritol 4-phosphate cytidylyltransferase [Bacteroidales bacterium]
MTRYIGIILAGGSGSRMGSDKPKQYLTLAGRTVLEHSIEAFAT